MWNISTTFLFLPIPHHHSFCVSLFLLFFSCTHTHLLVYLCILDRLLREYEIVQCILLQHIDSHSLLIVSCQERFIYYNARWSITINGDIIQYRIVEALCHSAYNIIYMRNVYHLFDIMFFGLGEGNKKWIIKCLSHVCII